MCFSLTADMSAEALSLEPLLSTKAIFTHMWFTKICVSCQPSDSLLCLLSKSFCYISLRQKKGLIFSSASVLMSSSPWNVLLLHLTVKKEHCPPVSEAIWVDIKILFPSSLISTTKRSTAALQVYRNDMSENEVNNCYVLSTVFNTALHQTKSLIMPSIFFQRARCCFCCVDDTGKMLISTNTFFCILVHHLKI